MSEREILIEQHNFIKALIFQFKIVLLILLRFVRNILFYKPKKFAFKQELKNAEVISISETDLWNTDDNEQNWILTAGKVQNLRVAAKKLNGLEIPASEVFSFWKHIGNPNLKKRGYVIGREIREGCIVPTIAGGLCQLSNALYDAALKADFKIIERHKHTRVVKGSLAEIDRDATVKWNYLDLRFKSSHAFRIEVEITSDKLLVKFKSLSKNTVTNTGSGFTVSSSPSTLNDCYSCGNWECFKHPDKSVKRNQKAITTYILDERWSEYEHYIKDVSKPTDHFIVPFKSHPLLKQNRSVWSLDDKKTKATWWTALYRAVVIRMHSRTKKNIFSTMLNLDKKVAQQMAKHIPLESTHLVISQNLLPFIWETGALGGRTFDVLMTRLPMVTLHERLNTAYQKYPASKTLNDFRAADTLVQLENTALTKAQRIITPHQEIASLFNNKSVKLNWDYPTVTITPSQKGNTILFPASALGRKGAYEVRQLARDLNLTIRITGAATEDDHFWKGIRVEKATTNIFENVQLVVYPTYIEHQPRLLLRAIALGIAVITTTASGLSETENVTIVPIGDYEELKRSVLGADTRY